MHSYHGSVFYVGSGSRDRSLKIFQLCDEPVLEKECILFKILKTGEERKEEEENYRGEAFILHGIRSMVT